MHSGVAWFWRQAQSCVLFQLCRDGQFLLATLLLMALYASLIPNSPSLSDCGTYLGQLGMFFHWFDQYDGAWWLISGLQWIPPCFAQIVCGSTKAYFPMAGNEFKTGFQAKPLSLCWVLRKDTSLWAHLFLPKCTKGCQWIAWLTSS